MVTHPWYVLHIPGTNSYVPIWTIAGFLLVLVIVGAIVGALGVAVSSKREDKAGSG